ncbi:MAG TPA: hypothetical protein VHZ55_25870 [Bryobacteraceae bacterium]|nr:hypothetical protein [Bryobacteraceae bacterium]
MAQATFPLFGAPLRKFSLCDAAKLTAATQLSFQQRACWYGSELASPWAAMRAGFTSGIGQWANRPYVKGNDGDDYAQRFAVYYVRRSTRDAGELLAGYLNHEDPRFHPSGETTTKKRVRSALLSVLIARSDEGSNRVALEPIVGSLGSAFAGAACYREHTGTGYALRGASLTYSSYFAKALYKEFQPDISFFVARKLHKKRD